MLKPKVILQDGNRTQIIDYEIGFFGQCLGVILFKRGEQDRCIMFSTVIEDDGFWYISERNKVSSSWLPEFINCLQQAQAWIEENAEVYQFEYAFKE